MPYANVNELPSAVKSALPSHGQAIYRAAFNSAHEQHGDESRAHATAWAAVKSKFKKQGDKWIHRHGDVADGYAVSSGLSFCDIGVIDGKPERTADGYMKAFARIARSGVQVYKGSELGRPELDDVKVFRPESEVFAGDAMRTLAHRPLTLHHPRENVGASNWRHYAVGYTGDEVVRDGSHVRVPLMLCDGAAINAAMHDGIKQLSVGYSADINWTPGRSPEGEQYDAVQSGIRANHVAVVPDARGGEMLRLADDTTPTTTCWSCAQRIPAGTARCPYCQEDQAYEPDGDIRTEADLHNAIKAMARGKNFSAEKARIYRAAKRMGKVAMSLLPEDWNVSDAAAFDDSVNHWDKEFSTEKRKKLAKSGAAMPHGGFPIENKSDLANAVQAYGRAKNPAATKAHIIKRARALGATSDLPDDWAVKDGKEQKMNIMVNGVPVEFADAAGAAYVNQELESLRKQVADARRKDAGGPAYGGKGGAGQNEVGGGQTEDQEPDGDEPDGTAGENKRRKKQTGENNDRRDARDGEIAALKKQLADAKAAATQDAIDKRAESRTALLGVALPMLDGNYNPKGRTDHQVMRDAVAAAGIPDADKMADAEVAGAFRALTVGANAQTPYSRTVDGLSNGLRMTDREAFNFASNNGPRNGVYPQRGLSLHDAKAVRDAAYEDKQRYQNTAWQGNGGYDNHGRNSNDFGRR